MTTFIAQSKDGHLHLGEYNAARLREFLKKHEGAKIKIQPVSGKVSEHARGYYFGAVIPLLQSLETGWKDLTAEEVHEILKKNFNGFVAFNPLTKREERYGQSIAIEDSKKFQDYLLRIADWLMENYSQTLPDPEEYKRFADSAQLK